MIDCIHWLGNSSFCITGALTIYINPWRVLRGRPADVILISDDHYEHLSSADIAKLRTDSTRVIGFERAMREVGGEPLRALQTVAIGRTAIKAVPAYFPDDTQYSAERMPLGFVVSMNYLDIYYGGMTGVIPEMKWLRPDIALLCVTGGVSPAESAQAVGLMKPKFAVPYRWSSNTRSEALALQSFVGRQPLNETQVMLLPETAAPVPSARA